MPNLSRWTIGGLSIATLFLFVIDTLIITGDMFIAVAHLTIVFQAIKSFDLKEPGPSAGIFYVPAPVDYCLGAYKVCCLWSHICYLPYRACYSNGYITFPERGHIKKIRLRGPVIAISLLTLVITILFFISIPRVIGGLWGKSRTKNIKTAGFSEKVDFGSFGDIKLDPTIVMRVEMPEKAEGQFYWRG